MYIPMFHEHHSNLNIGYWTKKSSKQKRKAKHTIALNLTLLNPGGIHCSTTRYPLFWSFRSATESQCKTITCSKVRLWVDTTGSTKHWGVYWRRRNYVGSKQLNLNVSHDILNSMLPSENLLTRSFLPWRVNCKWYSATHTFSIYGWHTVSDSHYPDKILHLLSWLFFPVHLVDQLDVVLISWPVSVTFYSCSTRQGLVCGKPRGGPRKADQPACEAFLRAKPRAAQSSQIFALFVNFAFYV